MDAYFRVLYTRRCERFVSRRGDCVAAYKTFRDSAIFTNKRLIIRDAQGLTGKKVEIYSLPYSSINMWSTENAGKLLDFNAEVELWTRTGHLK